MKAFRLLLTAAFACISLACSHERDIRNIALHRAAYHSSAMDYNFTAQLLTDGIVEKEKPCFYEVLENGVRAAKHRRESVFQGRRAVHFKIREPHYELAILEHGLHRDVDAMRLNIAVKYMGERPSVPPRAEFYATKDGGGSWESVGALSLDLIPGKETVMSLSIGSDPARNGYKLVLDGDSVKEWVLLGWDFFNGAEQILPPDVGHFQSLWVAEDEGPQWVTLDLGAVSHLDHARLYWVNRPERGSFFVSDDGLKWRKAGSLGTHDNPSLKGRGRYVRLEMEPAGNGAPIALSELEIWGSNELQLPVSRWILARADQADNPSAWLPAKVPGTVLASYTDAGAVPDISYGNDQEFISDSYFNSDFIYRGNLPFEGADGRRVFLDFGGINWKADMSLNGTALGSIEGAFKRGRFDVTELVRKGDNEVEVLVRRPAHPGAVKGSTLKRIPPNGGVLGADNPTFHASIGWDWIPTVRGRNIGIWRDVRFSVAGDVTVSDPLVQAELDLPRADVSVEAFLENHSSEARKVLWEGNIGDCSFAVPVELGGGESRRVSHTLRMENPRLWWPNGFGEPFLYDACVKLSIDGQPSDSLAFKAGIRQMRYSMEGGRLTAWINGRRVSGLGGNWGFSELNLRFSPRDYDIAVWYHKLMNFNMIRNWVGQTGDEEFYDACDRHGIMVWQDFWLANPTDGPDPDDESLFMENAADYVRKIRRHPSVVLYCGRNEGMPPASLDASLGRLVADLHGDILYIPDSADGPVSGRGPYHRMKSSDYFNLPGQDRMHSERGLTDFPEYETVRRFIPEADQWPQDDMWGIHDFAFENAQNGAAFNAAVESRFGKAEGIKEFSALAQWVNYDGFRAVFEGRSTHRRGLLLWMSHNAWPSLNWAPYDYYFGQPAGFFGSRKGCEPLHIQYNAHTGRVEVVNWCAGSRSGLHASARQMDLHGKVLDSLAFSLDSADDSTFEGPAVKLPSGVSFLILELHGPNGLLSENFYVLGNPEDDFQALCELPDASVSREWTMQEDEDCYLLTARLHNTGDVPAMMLRLTLLNDKPVNSGPAPAGLSDSSLGNTPQDYRILPAEWSDNYFHLMPGQQKNVSVRVPKRYFDIPLKPYLELSGYNLKD